MEVRIGDADDGYVGSADVRRRDFNITEFKRIDIGG